MLVKKAEERGLQISQFREPDMNNALTAITLEPGDRSRRLCRGLGLALPETESMSA